MVDLLPTERQSTSPPNTTFHPAVSPAQFGATVGQAQQEVGTAVRQVGRFWGSITADAAANQYQDDVNKLMHGDPNRTVTGPDGTQQPDLGYLGLRGRAALDQRATYAKKMDDLLKTARSGLLMPEQQERFDNVSRRYRAIMLGQMGAHADREGVTYSLGTADSQAKIAAQGLATNFENPEMVAHFASDMVDAYVKRAQILGAQPGDAQWTAAKNEGWKQAVSTQVSAVAVNDPAKAMRILENNKDKLGVLYDDLANKIRARAEQQTGREIGDALLSGSPPPNGADATAVVKHFEGFRSEPYWDVNHWRVGYGSDTITKPDGSVVEVTQNTKVTREDAERDLARRVDQSQGQVRAAIGQQAWDKLSPEAKASLTSVTYNYGRVPDEIVNASKNGGDMAAAIRSLARHNGGVNAGRRASEANNISPGGGAAPRSQADMIDEVKARHLPPQAEAAAIARITQSYRLNEAAETKRRAEFQQRVDDSTAEARYTGVTSTPLTEQEFVSHYGAANGAAKYADYASDLVYSADRHSLETMSDAEQINFLNSRIPQPGMPGYAHAMARHEKLQKAVAEMQKTRREDPSGAVAQNGAVQSALKAYDPNVPETFRGVAAARLAAQDRMGIEPEFQSPITKDEALKLTAPLRRVIAGDTAKLKETLNQMGTQFQQMFGDKADQAFSYAIRAHTVDQETSQQAVAVLRKLAKGESLVPVEARSADDQREMQASQQAIRGFPPAKAPGRAPLRTIDNPENAPSVEGSPVITRNGPTPKAIEFLLRNPGTDSDFDKKYGTGMAKEIRERYPIAPGLP